MKMKKSTKSKITLTVLISVLLIALVGAGCLGQNSSEQTVVVSGSTTVQPLMQAFSENYMETHSSVIISVKGGGSGVGIAELIDGTNDIAMSSREIRSNEISDANSKGITPTEHIVAFDGIAIIVHPSNSVDSLTIEQLQKIYSGEIKNWKEVGGADRDITVISRDSASGTQEYFQEVVMRSVPFRNDMIVQAATGAVTLEVSQNDRAIGFVGAAYQINSAKTLAINENGTNVMPTEANILNGQYPLSRPLYLYTDKTTSDAVTAFLNFMLSPAGQNIVRDMGYAPVK